jgi:predicted phosphohydrolase
MVTADFTTTIVVDQTPKEALDAINNVRGWWSEEIEGSTNKLNDEFMYHYEDVHRCKMKLLEVIPDKKVVWLVMDNYFNFTKDKSEWKGTKISFEISKKDSKTQIRFTHIGLVPEYECYSICRDAWSNYINNSLRSLIITGKGQPNSTGNPRIADEKKLQPAGGKQQRK